MCRSSCKKKAGKCPYVKTKKDAEKPLNVEIRLDRVTFEVKGANIP
jgi:hypothetical protein